MADVVATGVLDIIAEFDGRQMDENIAKGMERARDDAGRFAKEHRTISEQMMANFGSILSTGTNAAVTVMHRAMRTAADDAGNGFVSRIAAALGALPGSVGTALSSGLIATASAAARSAGDAASEKLAERVRLSAPYWKKAFVESFGDAASPGVKELISNADRKLTGLGDAFTKAGIRASASLGTSLAEAANVIAPAIQPLINTVREAGAKIGEVLGSAGRTGVSLLTKGISSAATAIRPVVEKIASSAASALETGMRKAGELGAKVLQLPFGKILGGTLGVALAGAIAVGGVKLVAGAVKLGAQAATSLVKAIGSGLSALGSAIASGVSAAASATVSAAAALGRGAAKALGDALKLGVNAASVSISAILGTALTKGFGRLKAIDNAEASLRGLAATADHVPEIMKAATNAVTGTAFGLDQAASAAAQFASARVPIEDMERHLGALANTAAGAGGDFDGMADIFSKVAARGHVTGEVLNQLTSRGVSGLSALADHFGISTEAVQEMVSNSEVSFDDFSRAMDKAMGLAAIEQATTFEGLMMNVGAAMGRFGAIMQKPFFNALKAVLPGVMNLFDQFGKVIQPIADIIGDRLIPFAEKLGEALGKLDFSAPVTDADKLFGSLGALAPVIGGIAAAFAGPLLTNIPVVGGLFSGLTGPVGVLLGALVAIFALKPETLVAGFETLIPKISSFVDKAIEAAGTLIPEMAQRFATSAPVLIEGFTIIMGDLVRLVAELAPMIIPVAVEAVATLISSLVTALGELAPAIITVAAEAIATLVTALIEAAPQLISAGAALLTGLADGIVQAIPILTSALPEVITSLIDALTAALPIILDAGVSVILALVDGIVGAIPALVDAIPEIISSLTTALTAVIPQLVTAGIALLLGLVDGIVQAIPEIIAAIPTIITALLEGIMTALPQLLIAGVQIIVALIGGIASAIPQLIDAIVTVLPELVGALIEALPLIIEAGLTLFLGLIGGLTEAVPQIIEAIIGLLPVFLEQIIAMLPDLILGAIELFLGIATGIGEAAPEILLAIVALLPQFLSTIGDMSGSLVTAALDLFSGMADGIRDSATKLLASATELVTDLIDNVKDFAGDFVDAAGDLISGLVQGIKDGASRVLGAITDLASDAIDSFKNFLGIASPSKLFRSFGENMGEGLADGIDSMQGAVSSSLDNLLPGGMDADFNLNSTVSGGSVGGSSVLGGVGGGGGGQFLVFDSSQPIEFVIVDQDNEIIRTIRTEIGKALRPTSRSSIRAYSGVMQ